MSAASNTKGCFREVVGKRVVGVLFDSLPNNDYKLRRGTKTLVFEDGRGLTISSSGSYWIDSAEEVSRAVERVEKEMRAVQEDLPAHKLREATKLIDEARLWVEES